MASDDPTPPSTVFISHAAADDAWAEWIRDQLVNAGFSAWLDRSALQPGQSWRETTRTAIEAADKVVVLISRDAVASEWTNLEIAWAREASKPVVAAVVDRGVALPADLQTGPVVDVTGPSRDEVARRLVAALSGAQEALTTHLPGPVIGTDVVERRSQLHALDQALIFTAPGATRAAVVTGAAGIGKSTLAWQFAQSRGEHFSAVHRIGWTPDTVHLLDKVQLLNLVQSVPDAHKPVLLIIEDVDTEDTAALAPASPNVAVLLTSRNVRWPPPFIAIRLEPLSMQEAIEVVQQINPHLSRSEAGELAGAAGGIPALLAAVARIAQRRDVRSVLQELADLQVAVRGTSAAGAAGFYYLDSDDPQAISEFERAFQKAVAPDGSLELHPAERGSWRRRFARRYTPERVEQILDKAERAAEVAGLAKPEGEANRDNAEAIARLLEASESIPNLVVSSGSVLLVKITDVGGPRVFSKTLTATEMRLLEQHQEALAQPAEALKLLNLLSAGSSPAAFPPTE